MEFLIGYGPKVIILADISYVTYDHCVYPVLPAIVHDITCDLMKVIINAGIFFSIQSEDMV